MKKILVGVFPLLFGSFLYAQGQSSQTGAAAVPGASVKGVEVRAVINLRYAGSTSSSASGAAIDREAVGAAHNGEIRLYRRALTMNQSIGDLHAWKNGSRGVLHLEWTGQNKCLQTPSERLDCFFAIRLFDAAGQRVAYFVSRPLERAEKLLDSDSRLRFMDFKLEERELQQTAQVEFSYVVVER